MLPLLLMGQQAVSGYVRDAGTDEGLAFATVVNLQNKQGTNTDAEGYFELNAQLGDTLRVTFIGMESTFVPVESFEPMNIPMASANTSLDEVVVIGFSTATKKELTGAVSVVKGEAIEALNPTRLEQALQGQTAGVQISSQSGSPGGGFNIRIRGISTNGNNNPLILVDGVRYEDLGSLDPTNIESINVLKDASASIYGVQAANGVVLITTKNGQKNAKPTVDFNAFYGIQETARKIPVLNASEYAVIVNEAYVNGGSLPPFSSITGLGAGTDWQDEVFETAPIQSYNLNVRGGGERSTYSFGGGYFSQDGIVGGDNARFERITGNLNIETDVTQHLKFLTVAQYTHTERKSLLENTIGSVLFNALNMAPTLAVRDEQGNFTKADGLGIEVINPLAQIANTFNNTLVDRVNGKVGFVYNPLEGLSVETNLGFNYSNVLNNTFSPMVDYGPGKVFNNVESSVSESTQLFTSLAWDNFLNYERTFNDIHKFKLTLGASTYEERYRGLFGTGFGIPNNSVEFAALSQANEIRVGGANSGQGIFRLLSYFGRVEYNYNYRYLVSVILRRDGTTRFGPNFRFGYFPSVSVGWIASEEEFAVDWDAVSYLKFRASYGETGNDRIGDFRYLASLNGEAEYVFDGNEFVNGQTIGAIPNPDIRWERNRQFNIGLDLNLFEDRISVTADYFLKESTDLLLAVPVSGLTGAAAPGSSAPIANAGSIRNTGVEFQINYRETFGSGLGVDVGFNLTQISNETLALNDGVAFIQGGAFGIGQLPPTRWEVGQPIGYFFGLQTDGIFQNQSEIERHAAQPNAKPGDLRYVDLNGDGSINEQDRTFIGNPIPDFTLGGTLNLTFKGFDFSAFAEAQLGRDLVRNYERNLPLTNRTAYHISRWRGEGTSDDFPRVSIGANDNDLFSDFYIEDGSYLRIKNVQLGYSLPQAILDQIGFGKVRVYASINNLFTFTNYQGYDPNISSGSPLASGIDIGFYPQARNYLTGVKIIF